MGRLGGAAQRSNLVPGSASPKRAADFLVVAEDCHPDRPESCCFGQLYDQVDVELCAITVSGHRGYMPRFSPPTPPKIACSRVLLWPVPQPDKVEQGVWPSFESRRADPAVP